MLIEMLIAWTVVVPALVVSGLYVAAGYLSRPERTARRWDVARLLDELTITWEQPGERSVPAEA